MNPTAWPRYERYKDSGEGWIEHVPAHWESRKLKQLFQEKRHRSNLALNSGAISFGEVVEKDDDRIPLTTKASYQEVLKGEFLINPLNLNYDLKSLRIGLSDINVVVSAGYIVLQAKDEMDKRYFKYLLHRYDVANMKLLGSGVRQTISFNHIANSILVAPPLPEQRAIAAFLDEKCAKVDEAVRINEEQIALLRERRQILIQQAVTRGLNASAPMKDSGIDWVGHIPEHWETKRAKFLFREINECSLDGTEELLSVSHTTGVTSRAEKNISMFMAEDYTGAKICRPGDVVFNAMWAWMGALGVSNVTGLVSPSYGVYRQLEQGSFNNKYLEWLLRSNRYVEHYNRISTGLHSSRLRLYAHMFLGMFLGFPSRVEQDEIVAFVEAAAGKIDAGMAIKKEQIAALKEYKTSLINAAVTGKIRVA